MALESDCYALARKAIEADGAPFTEANVYELAQVLQGEIENFLEFVLHQVDGVISEIEAIRKAID